MLRDPATADVGGNTRLGVDIAPDSDVGVAVAEENLQAAVRMRHTNTAGPRLMVTSRCYWDGRRRTLPRSSPPALAICPSAYPCHTHSAGTSGREYRCPARGASASSASAVPSIP